MFQFICCVLSLTRKIVVKTKLALAISAALITNVAYAKPQESYSDELSISPTLLGLKNLKAASLAEVKKAKFYFESNLPSDEKFTYIIRLVDSPVAQYQGIINDLPATALTQGNSKKSAKINMASPSVKSYVSYLRSKQSQFKIKAASIGIRSESLFNYQYAFNGLALKITQSQAQKLHQLPEVISVEREAMYELNTDVSQELIGSPRVWNGTATGTEAKGEGVIVGVVDTGINTDHPSFADIGGDGFDHTNPWGQGVYVGDCAGDFSDLCNDKLIGVRSYDVITGNYDDTDVFGDTPPAKNGEDYNGHGSHVASTAAGNILKNVTYVTAEVGVEESDGLPTTLEFEQISGVAPHANIVSYQICNPGNSGDTYARCPGAAIVAALDDAIKDEVDVINYSISGGGFPWSSSTEMSFLAARDAGIFVAAAAGNTSQSVSQTPGSSPKHAPWYTSVAASTHDRQIGKAIDADDLTISFNDGSAPVFTEAVTGMLAYAGNIDSANFEGCTAFEADSFDGKIALISRGACAFVDKVTNAVDAGATAVIIYNSQPGNAPVNMGGLENVTVPAVGIGNADGLALVQKLADNPTLEVTLNVDPQTTTKEADVLASFSLLGPNPSIDVVAPSVAAPGVDIYAAYSDQHFGHDASGPAPSDFDVLSGTSMASPHVAGAGALLKSAHPSWTPDNIRSALMLTATTAQEMKKANGETAADAFDVGAGRIRVDLAAKAGLIMDETADNYANADPRLGGDPKTLNTPSMANSNCDIECTWTRTVTATADGTWSSAGMTVSGGMVISVAPADFTLTAGESQELTITANVEGVKDSGWQFGNLILTSDDHPTSTMPVTVQAVRTNLPEQFELETGRSVGSDALEGLRHLDLSGLSVSVGDLAKELSYNGAVAQDSDNSSATDDLFDGNHINPVFVPYGSQLFTAEITVSSAPDLDLYIIADYEGDGILDEIVASSLSFGSEEHVSVMDPTAGIYYIFVNNWEASNENVEDLFTAKYTVVGPENSERFNAYTTGTSDEFDINLNWDTELVEGDTARSVITLHSSDDSIAPVKVPFTLIRGANEVELPSQRVIAPMAEPGSTSEFRVDVIANNSNTDKNYTVTAKIPAGHEIDDILTPEVASKSSIKYLNLASTGTSPSAQSTDVDTVITWNIESPAGSSAQMLGFNFTPIKAGEDFEIQMSLSDDSSSEPYTQTYTFDVEDVAPTVMLQAPATSEEGETVNLTTEGTYEGNGDELSYLWELTSSSNVNIEFNATDANISFVAPETDEDGQELTFTVTVTDENGNATTETATVSITANSAPSVSLSDVTVVEGNTVNLVATSSDSDNDDLTFTWAQESGDAVEFTENGHAINFTAPAGEYSFSVIANDGRNDSAKATANVIVTEIVNNPPVVVVSNVSTQEGNLVTLKAVASDPESDELTYAWTQTSGEDIEFTEDGTSISFTAPTAGTYTFEVVVSDGASDISATSTVTVTAVPTPEPTPEPEPEPRRSSSGSLGWLALLLTPMAFLRRRNK